jgi:hypothetical protein
VYTIEREGWEKLRRRTRYVNILTGNVPLVVDWQKSYRIPKSIGVSGGICIMIALVGYSYMSLGYFMLIILTGLIMIGITIFYNLIFSIFAKTTQH